MLETATHKLLCEPKMKKEVDTDEIQEKARAAAKWCERATKYGLKHGGKSWTYILILHNAIQPSTTLAGLVSRFKT